MLQWVLRFPAPMATCLKEWPLQGGPQVPVRIWRAMIRQRPISQLGGIYPTTQFHCSATTPPRKRALCVVRVHLHIICDARIEIVGKYQSYMVSKLRNM